MAPPTASESIALPCAHGALLVRPDGHIAARRPDGPPADDALRSALATLTASTPR
ncbi:hypothetical protein [Streptomyces sp. NBC_00019]|uniref:aromatic-ring hydroxylase C-terminal domain-containing protein n=1 Tax=Streptomyces sp. NBC_00019 TaxID=2975623 RepID=UPI0032430B2C